MINIIYGVTGQTGSYLAEQLIGAGQEVVGVVRRTSSTNNERIKHITGLKLIEGDVTDSFSVNSILKEVGPDRVFNMSAQSHVGTSFKQPAYTFQVTAGGCLNILEAIRTIKPDTKMLQASSSEMFGKNYSTRLVDNPAHPLYGKKDANIFEFFKRTNGQIKEPMTLNEKYQNENTPFGPQSPYAIAKLAAHHLVDNYRDSYGLFAACSICFNHETLSYGTPIIIKDTNDKIDILPIGDVARFHSGVIFNLEQKSYQEGKPLSNIKIWDQSGWVDIKWVSGYPHDNDDNKNPRIINARNYTYMATSNHPCIMEDNKEKETGKINTGDKVKLISYPDSKTFNEISLNEAEWLGMLVGDGNLKRRTPRFTNKNYNIKKRFGELWMTFAENPKYKFKSSKSGFTGEEIGQIECFGKYENLDIYTDDISPFGHKNKKVPKCILNSSIDIMEAFLIGYNYCDGLKKSPCNYRFKNFTTNSPTLASGLLFLISKVTGQKYNITVEESWKYNKQQFYYSINLLSDNQSSINKYNIVKDLLSQNLSMNKIKIKTGISYTFISKVKNGYIPSNKHYLELPSNEVKKIIDVPNYNGWFFDFETSSGTFHAGVGNGVVHNSPRRGPEFVTRKITKWIGEFYKWCELKSIHPSKLVIDKEELYIGGRTSIEQGFQFPKLRLGNINVSRDWGHARDYAKAMEMILDQDSPEDYVICTGKTYTVNDFLKIAFECIGIENYMDYVVIDPQFFRPSDVEYLRGDSGKIKEKIGWGPEVSFESLVKEMVECDING